MTTMRGSATTLRGAGLWVGLLVAAVIGAAVGGLGVGLASSGAGTVRPGGDVAGTVTLVNADGTSLCLDQDRGGGQLCTDFVAPRGIARLSQGAHVSGTLLSVPRDSGSSQVLVVTQVAAAP